MFARRTVGSLAIRVVGSRAFTPPPQPTLVPHHPSLDTWEVRLPHVACKGRAFSSSAERQHPSPLEPLPPSEVPWGLATSSTCGSFNQRSADVRHKFLVLEKPNPTPKPHAFFGMLQSLGGKPYRAMVPVSDGFEAIKSDPDCTWKRMPAMDPTAASLVQLGRDLRVRIQRTEDNPAPEQEYGDDNIQYLGNGVYALRPRGPILEADAGETDAGPEIIVRTGTSTVVSKALQETEIGKRVYVVGQPGIGKTRGGLSYALMQMLVEGAPVVRLDYKAEDAFLFLPREDGRYMVWKTKVSKWANSVLSEDCRMVCLVDPAEDGITRPNLGKTSSITFCSNNSKHYHNAKKDHKVLYAQLPTENEIAAMTPVLWREGSGDNATDPQGAIPLETKGDAWASRKAAMVTRARLVGSPAPRYIFNSEKYFDRAREIEKVAKVIGTSMTIEQLVAEWTDAQVPEAEKQGVADQVSKMYNLDVWAPTPNDTWMDFTYKINDLAAAAIAQEYYNRVESSKGASGGWKFEKIALWMLRLGGKYQTHMSAAKSDKSHNFVIGSEDALTSITLPRRTLLRGGNKQQSIAALSSLDEKSTQLLVPTIPTFPVLDCATSRLQWYQVKVSESSFHLHYRRCAEMLRAINIQKGEQVQLTIVHNGRQVQPRATFSFGTDAEASEKERREEQEQQQRKDIEMCQAHIKIRFLNLGLQNNNTLSLDKALLTEYAWPQQMPKEWRFRLSYMRALRECHSDPAFPRTG